MSDTHELATETDKKLAVHEAVCAQRYQSIQERFDDGSKRMQRIEYILYLIATMVMLGSDHTIDLLKHFVLRG